MSNKAFYEPSAFFFPPRQELFVGRDRFAPGVSLKIIATGKSATIGNEVEECKGAGFPPLRNDQVLDACSVDCSSSGRPGRLWFLLVLRRLRRSALFQL